MAANCSWWATIGALCGVSSFLDFQWPLRVGLCGGIEGANRVLICAAAAVLTFAPTGFASPLAFWSAMLAEFRGD